MGLHAGRGVSRYISWRIGADIILPVTLDDGPRPNERGKGRCGKLAWFVGSVDRLEKSKLHEQLAAIIQVTT